MLQPIDADMLATSQCVQQHSLGPQQLAAACWSGVYDTVPLPVLLQQVQVLLQALNLMVQRSAALLTCQPAWPITRVAITLCEQCLLVRCMACCNESNCVLSDAVCHHICNAGRCSPVDLLCDCWQL